MRGTSSHGTNSSQGDWHLARHFGTGEMPVLPETIASRWKPDRNDISTEDIPHVSECLYDLLNPSVDISLFSMLFYY
jgi:hypothetical protein